MNGLLPGALRAALAHHSVVAASESFGLVALVVALLLLTALELLRLSAERRRQLALLQAIALPLLVAFALTAAARIALLLQ